MQFRFPRQTRHFRPAMRRLGMMAILTLVGVPIATAQVDPTKEEVAQQAPKKDQTLAVFNLGSIQDSSGGDNPFASGGGESLRTLVGRIDKATEDDKIAGMVLLADGVSVGRAQLEEIHQALDRFKAAGKEIHAHSDSLSTGTLNVLAPATNLVVVPTGDVWITGLYGESPYLKNLFDLLGVEPDFSTCGDYKAAAEMFTRSGPSEEARENDDWLLDGIFDNMVASIAKGRGVDEKTVSEWIDGAIYSAEAAKEKGIINGVAHRRAFADSLRDQYGSDLKFDKRYGKKKPVEIDLSSPFGVMKFYADLLSGPKKPSQSGDAIAVVHVEGPIMVGSMAADPFALAAGGGGAFSTPIRDALLKAADDDNVKAVVLRVDSPGGSAVASEIILDATKIVAEKKPLVVSMGNVAASGGYYVACGADTVFADPSTITGSIGVVGGKLATGKVWKRVGVNWVSNQRGANADLLSGSNGFTDEQRDIWQGWMDEVYEVFKGHVVEIRGDRLKKPIDELAGGRVYTGRQALEFGMVDKLGGFNDALEFAADEAGIEKYRVVTLPEPVNFLDALLGQDTKKDDPHKLEVVDDTAAQRAVQRIFGQTRRWNSAADNYQWANDAFGRVAPEIQQLDPARVGKLRRALLLLSVLRSEGVSLHAPLWDTPIR